MASINDWAHYPTAAAAVVSGPGATGGPYPQFTPGTDHQFFDRGGVGNSELRYDAGANLEWSKEEDGLVREALVRYASVPATIRYATISKMLQAKCARDVAFRCRWMVNKESEKIMKKDLGKQNDKNANPADASANPLAQLAAIGGVHGQLLGNNLQFLDQISRKLSNNQVQESTGLMCATLDNLKKLMNETKDIPGMPPLPVIVNEKLANNLVSHRWTRGLQSSHFGPC